MAAEWHFARQRPGGSVYNPLGEEHFNQGTVGDSDWEAGEALVREAIQNSLDAAQGDAEVCVRLDVHEPPALSAAIAGAWFGSLWPHVRAKDCRWKNLPARPDPGGFICIEDFGTSGLERDPKQWNMPQEGERNNFFSFFRAEGLSDKSDLSGGSWGVGKSVFSRCSVYHTFLALSIRNSDRGIVLMGKSLLRHHYIDGVEYRAEGHFGTPQSEGSDLILPSDDAALLQRFKTDFKIKRPLGGGREGEAQPGLSIVIPYSDLEVTAPSLLSIVVREYFQPILTGKLRVVITGQGLPGGSVTLSSDTIIREAGTLRKPKIVALLNLAEWAHAEGKHQALMLRDQPAFQAPAWGKGLFPTDQPVFDELCERFERGDRVAIRVPLRVYAAHSEPQRSWFDVFLQRDLEGDGHKPVFVRAGLVVPNARERAVRGHALFGLVNIPDGPLAVMLRAAEPPSHLHWSDSTRNFKGRYDHGRQTIDFVVSAPKQIADILASAASERDVLALADFFPEPDDVGREGDVGAGAKKRRRAKATVPLGPPRPKPFRIEAVPGGFTITRASADTTPLPSRLEVRIAYDTSRGNPLRKYHRADFNLPDMHPSIDAAEALQCEGNLLVVAPTSDDFRITVEGFDQNRDLLVKVKTKDSSAAAPDDGGEDGSAEDAPADEEAHA